jgi:hypothetical protein
MSSYEVARQRKPWLRRSYPFQRTRLSDHGDLAFAVTVILVALMIAGLMLLAAR